MIRRYFTLFVGLLLFGSAAAKNPLPEAARGIPVDPEKGYHVEEIGDGLHFVTDGGAQAMFLSTGAGVIMVDAPPSIGENLLSAVAEVTNEPVTHLVYSHSHLDHIGAAGLFPDLQVIIAQEDAAAQLASAANPGVPLPTETFSDSFTVKLGTQTLQLDYHGPNHEPGNIFIYAPAQKTLMLVDVIFPGWVPFKGLAVSEDIPGWVETHDIALSYDFDTFLGGHLSRPGTREDVEIAKAYVMDVQANAGRALQEVDFAAFAQQYGFQNPWLTYGAYLDEVVRVCTEATVPAWVDRLGGAAEFTASHCGVMEQSLRIDPW